MRSVPSASVRVAFTILGVVPLLACSGNVGSNGNPGAGGDGNPGAGGSGGIGTITGNAGRGGTGGGGGSTPFPNYNGGPKLFSEMEVMAVANDAAAWSARKATCDGKLNSMIDPDYAGWGWRDAAEQFGMCYLVAKKLGLDATTVSNYQKKLLAILKVLGRHHFYGTPSHSQEFLALGDGSTRTFTLRMPSPSGKVTAFLTPAVDISLTYGGTVTNLPGFYPVLKVGDTANSSTYTRDTDYLVSYGGELQWVGSKHPAMNTTFHALVCNGGFNNASGVSVSGTTLTFTTAPPSGQAVFVQYMGPDYEQTGNYLGGVGGVRPDSGYAMRSVNAGLALAYDALRETPELSVPLRQEMYKVMNGQVDWYEAKVKSDPYIDNELGNYFVRGHMTGVVFTALATDGDNPRAMAGGDLKTLARGLLQRNFDSLKNLVPGGYGPEGSYDSGSNYDELRLYYLWRLQTQEDLAGQLEWTANYIPATIHGTKPNMAFYDGGDWSEDPPVPPITGLQGFVLYQADHPMAPFARQLLSELDEAVPGATADYRTGADAFPLSFLAKGTGAIYARSAWTPTATWMSLATGPIFEPGHQHYDRGHFTLQRGADYLIMNAGGYGVISTLPFHNTVGFDDRGAGNKIVYPPGQGAWGPVANNPVPKHFDGDSFVYGQEDFASSYMNSDEKTNSVTRAVRTMVYIRPEVVVVHDQAQTAAAAVKKIFNVNFNAATVARSGDVFSSVTGGSKVFMRSLIPANPTPVMMAPGTTVKDMNAGDTKLKGTNYQVTISGQTAQTFLHVFQMTESGRASMANTALVTTTDGRAEGAVIDLGTRRWVVLSSVSMPVLSGGTLTYSVGMTCPCTHVIGDLSPGASYTVTAAGADATVTVNDAGVLAFTTDNGGVSEVRVTAQ